jgi:hypothetical protein
MLLEPQWQGGWKLKQFDIRQDGRNNPVFVLSEQVLRGCASQATILRGAFACAEASGCAGDLKPVPMALAPLCERSKQHQ